MALDTPQYSVEATIGPVEIRRYEPLTMATTAVAGSHQSAGNAGFGILARYIFGGNSSAAGGVEKIAMTTPVMQVPSGNRFEVRFMMPPGSSVETLPVPTDHRVTLTDVGAQTLAAVRYRGGWSKELHDRQLGRLRAALDGAGIPTTGDPIWARYDPLWKPWFLRHNEVLLTLEHSPHLRATAANCRIRLSRAATRAAVHGGDQAPVTG